MSAILEVSYSRRPIVQLCIRCPVHRPQPAHRWYSNRTQAASRRAKLRKSAAVAL